MIIQFGLINFKHLLIFLSPFVYSTKRFFVKKNEKRNTFYSVFINFLSLMCCGTLHLLSIFLSKSEKGKGQEQGKKVINNNSRTNSLEDASLESNNSLKAQLIEAMKLDKDAKIKIQKTYQKIFIILLSSLQIAAEIIQKVSSKHANWKFNKSLLIILELFFFIIFSMLFLNFNLFLHQFVSLGLFLACHIIFFILACYYHDDITINEFSRSLLYIFSYEKLYCLLNVLGKKYLNSFNDSVYLFLFKIGLIGLPPLMIYDLIANVSGLSEDYHGIFETIFHHFEIWKFLRDFIYSVFVDIGIWLTINYFSPCHYIILDIVYNFLGIIIDYIKDEDYVYSKEEKITFMIFYPILILDLLVFNEIVILNFWDLNKNTKLYIMEREINEHKFTGEPGLGNDADEDNSEDD